MEVSCRKSEWDNVFQVCVTRRTGGAHPDSALAALHMRLKVMWFRQCDGEERSSTQVRITFASTRVCTLSLSTHQARSEALPKLRTPRHVDPGLRVSQQTRRLHQ